MTKTKILHSPDPFIGEDKNGNRVEGPGGNVVAYKIEEAELDDKGDPVMDTNTGRPKWTGKTLEWTIKAGETVEFPTYVADYLMKIYGFLREVKPEETKKEEMVKRVGEKTGEFTCKYCGKAFKRARDLGLHIGLKHRDKII